MEKNVILAIAVVVSLAIGGVGGYLFTSSQVTRLINEKADWLSRVASLSSDKNQLQNQVASLTEEKTTLETQITTLDTEKTSLQTQVNSLTSENTDLTDRYNLLAETIDAIHSSGWILEDSYNITAGTLMNQTFVLDNYGIVWDTVLDFTGTTLRVSHYYWYEGIRHYVTSFSRSLLTNSTGFPYHGPQDYLYGTTKIDISLDYRNTNRLWIGYNTRTQFPDITISGNSFANIGS
jgi:cell division protein FtsB